MFVDAPYAGHLHIQNIYLAVDSTGIITYTGDTLPPNTHTENVIEIPKGKFFLPGFIDCHIHAPQYATVATQFGKPLMEWLEASAFPAERKCKEESLARDLYTKVVLKTLQNGTTTASYFGTIFNSTDLILADVCETNHQRAFVGKVCQDKMIPNDLCEVTEDSIVDAETFVDTVLSKNYKYVRPIVTPRFAVSCSLELMSQLSALASKKDIFIQTHLSENTQECELIAEMYPDCKNYTDVYEKVGCLTSKTLLAHSIHLSDDEIEVIKNHESCLIHCPVANLSMKSGFFRFKKLYQMGVKIGMGTDVAGGYSPSMIEVMKMAMLVGNISSITNNDAQIDFGDVLYMATMGGAKCLNLDKQIGSFENGKKFDALLIDLTKDNTNIDLFDWNTQEDMVERFILQGDSRNIAQVYVDGTQIEL
ncbi:guanine deaminase, putative [Entamoeba invadens IP1]|uniref:Guanine deaminase n=1 Tax=Entamoeba invadens IP1 TaxID=370355 RepID=A0A0A1UB20_ENTIV|nr:guanine deaminase, putative [Entamoeba invadens IP1]ELP90357.1 guanine deaminase, putative [Entamoeba invadens IP1]|eukprot:XP_004257128.1 guanine deaminase, putative [Entamoeba invadens IP1]